MNSGRYSTVTEIPMSMFRGAQPESVRRAVSAVVANVIEYMEETIAGEGRRPVTDGWSLEHWRKDLRMFGHDGFLMIRVAVQTEPAAGSEPSDADVAAQWALFRERTGQRARP